MSQVPQVRLKEEGGRLGLRRQHEKSVRDSEPERARLQYQAGAEGVVDGVERDVLQFIYDATPTGQEMQYSRKDTDKALAMSAYAAGLTVITTGIGMFFFKRKDLR